MRKENHAPWQRRARQLMVAVMLMLPCVLGKHQRPAIASTKTKPMSPQELKYQRLIRLLHSHRTKRVARAKRALKRAGAKAYPAILKAFATPSLRMRLHLLSVLPPLNQRMAKHLGHLIRRGKGKARSGAMYALAHIKRRTRHLPGPLLRLLLWRLRRGPWYVRGAAAYVLAQQPQTKRIRQALLRALRDHSWRVKGNAATGLKRAGNKGKRELMRALKSPTKYWTVHATAKGILHPPPSTHKVRSRTQGKELRILTYNICHGAGMDGSYSLARIARLIRKSKAEIVGLQEVDRGTRRSLKQHQLKRLARMLRMHAVFGPAISFQGGRFGNGLLSRYPIVTHKIHKLPKLGGWEPRSIIDAVVAIPTKRGKRKLRVLNTHLDNRSAKAQAEATKRIHALIRKGEPTLLIGDLNAAPTSQTMQLLSRDWSNPLVQHPLPSMPATVPIFQIDYILYRPRSAWTFQSARVDNSPLAQMASDHRPVLMKLRWHPPTKAKRRP